MQTTHPLASGPAVWRGDEIANHPVHRLTHEQARDILAVARAHDASPRTLANTDFTHLLPSFAPMMRQVRDDVANGCGVSLVRGLPVGEMTDAQCAVAYWALGNFLGQGVAQSSSGDLIGYVQDQDNKIRSYLNRSGLRFHVDLADIVGLLCVRRAMSGGRSMIASSLAVYNEMALQHPHYLDALASGFRWSRNNEESPGEPPYSAVIPVFTVVNGVVSCRLNTSMIRRGAQALGTELTPLQDEALLFFEACANRLCYSTLMEPGDIQFLNNYTVLHSRTEFENWPDPQQHRLLLRLWLRDDNIRDFGPYMQRMRDEPLIYNKQGRTPLELLSK